MSDEREDGAEEPREDVLLRIGNHEIVGKRRAPDDPVRVQAEEFRDALRELGAAVRDAMFASPLGRLANWFVARLAKWMERRP